MGGGGLEIALNIKLQIPNFSAYGRTILFSILVRGGLFEAQFYFEICLKKLHFWRPN